MGDLIINLDFILYMAYNTYGLQILSIEIPIKDVALVKQSGLQWKKQ